MDREEALASRVYIKRPDYFVEPMTGMNAGAWGLGDRCCYNEPVGVIPRRL